jgi:hypothetical protein
VSEEDNLKKLYDRWRGDSVAYVRECIGVGRLKDNIQIDSLQEKALREFDNLQKYKILKDKGEGVPKGLEKYAGKIGIQIDSGKGLGKTSFASWLILKRIHLYPHVGMCLCTAPKQDLLRDNLWGECSRWVNYSKKVWGEDSLLLNAITIQADSILNKYFASDTYAVARTSSRQASESDKKATLQGYHAPYLLILADESYGLDDCVFDPITSTMTDIKNIAVLLGNPSKNWGYVHNTKHSMREYWINLRFSAEESSLISSDYIKQKKKEYENSPNLYRVNILGLPPLAEADGLIPYDKLQIASSSEADESLWKEYPVVLGVDIGGGGDETVCTIRQGAKVYPQVFYNSADMVEVANWVEKQIDKYEPVRVGIDGIGIGRGVYDILRNKGFWYVDFVDVRKSGTSSYYKNLRAELYWRLRNDIIEEKITISSDDILIQQLAGLKLANSKDVSMIQIQSKKDMISSPDRADSLMLTSYYNFNRLKKNKEDDDEARYSMKKRNNAMSFMCV